MASRSTFAVLLLFIVFISKSYGWFTFCEPYVDQFEDIQAHLHSIGPKYGVSYSGEKKDTSPTVQRLVDRLDHDRVKYSSAKETTEKYTADKLNHYKVTPTVKGSASEVENLKEIFRMLDAKNDAYLSEVKQDKKKYVEKEQELNIVMQQIQILSDAIGVLEKVVNERNITLSKTREIQTNLRKTIADRGLQ
ncbi:uncharacterized protein LOC128713201 [Anopheles marshallii]|uniref:uncharacterized protein LOC128713201 n=1 Tax=Anopheles marshallii TaxID=1521116 RepID=UPI00237A6C35|nr:uncharacterized protein LOC128713201 [Anopheles marshallii]